ncbi:hypothetical protein BRD17_09235 [Halobacteriales archaeon SW_7_68_16]|nr:MAG: hypothetical protein BRD17_09235 [Halobacteriales archaeon SW_7_68_16]
MVTLDPVGDLTTMVETFTEVALSDPASALLLAVGSLLTGVTVVYGTYLGVGAAIGAATR